MNTENITRVWRLDLNTVLYSGSAYQSQGSSAAGHWIKYNIHLYITERLKPAVMKPDVRSVNPDLGWITAVLALPDGGTVISHRKDNKYHVVRLDDKGKASPSMFTSDTGINGFILLQDDQMVILQKDGNLTWIQIKDGKKMDQYKVNVTYLQHGIALDNDTLLLVDSGGRVFTFSKSSRKTNDMVNNLNHPTTVDRTLVNNEVVYVVCEWGANTVRIYSDDWRLQRSVTGDGQVRFNYPQSAVVLPDNTILVSDYINDCISEWSLDGKFLGYLIQKGDIKEPFNMSFHHPYVWIRYGEYPYNVRCYQIYK